MIHLVGDLMVHVIVSLMVSG